MPRDRSRKLCKVFLTTAVPAGHFGQAAPGFPVSPDQIWWVGKYCEQSLRISLHGLCSKRFTHKAGPAGLEKLARDKGFGLWRDGGAMPPWEFRALQQDS